MRELVLDVETTGLEFEKDRITEIAIVELFDRMPTGEFLQFYINPKIEITKEAEKITGLTNEFLNNKPLFQNIWPEIKIFLSNSNIIAHNSDFDRKMINYELKLMGLNSLDNKFIDTLAMARKFFGSQNTLDNLAKRFKVNKTDRKLHGALKDCYVLANVYYHLCFLSIETNNIFEIEKKENDFFVLKERKNPSILTMEEMDLHNFFLENVIKIK